MNNTNFPLINMQQLKHIIFQNLLNDLVYLSKINDETAKLYYDIESTNP